MEHADRSLRRSLKSQEVAASLNRIPAYSTRSNSPNLSLFSTTHGSSMKPSLTTAQIAGCATEAQKQKVLLWLQFVSKGFAGSIVERITPVRYDVALVADGTTSTDPNVADASARTRGATLVCDLVIGDDMLNGYKSLHGGAAAFLVDVCTSVALSAFSNGHVSVNLNVDYHQPIPL
ncbi:hypothetical protein M408DRAFT_19619 [Serendipita vermifera MAFF 305830]|uniref:Thioesterase domain-containing protein n=1 Tax=Serendipita vermifera MAFF 305830 TaxID=933852 RepID=A0A0C3BMH1_SERVB|nr:hypothetical protein M408DRAFT_19619 [Serendipita vermifera MAFF 305830]